MVLPDHKPALTRWFHPAPGEVVIDVGAHVGFFSVVAAGAGARVIAIEPNPDLVVQLRRNLSLNAAGSVQVIEGAAGEREGMETLYVPGTVRGFGTLDPHRFGSTSSGPAPQWAAVRVPVRSLDALGDRSLPGVIDWLLIDTEGGEAGVLRGAPKMLARTRRVVVEVTQGGGAAEVDRILRSAGFSLRERAPQTPRTEYRFFERSEPLPLAEVPDRTPNRSGNRPSDAN